MASAGGLYRLPAIMDHHRLEPLPLKIRCDQRGGIAVIFHYQHGTLAADGVVHVFSLIRQYAPAHPFLRFISSIFAGILPSMPTPSFFMTKWLLMNSLVMRIR